MVMDAVHSDGGPLWTPEALARELSSWYVHVPKGRDALRALAAEEEVDPDALFSAAVKLWDKRDARSFRYRTKEPTPGERVRVAHKDDGLVLEVGGPKAVRWAKVELDNGVTVAHPVTLLGEAGTADAQLDMFGVPARGPGGSP